MISKQSVFPKREMIFVQSFCDNFLSHTYIILLFSFFLFLSPLFLTNKKRERERKIVTKVVSNNCSNITTLSKKYNNCFVGSRTYCVDNNKQLFSTLKKKLFSISSMFSISINRKCSENLGLK